MPRRTTKLRAALSAALLTTSTLAAVAVPAATAAVPAGVAATPGVTCTPTQPIFAPQTSDGVFWHYPFNDLSSTATPVNGTRTKVGTSWDTYTRIFGSSNGYVYGLRAAGLFQYHWNGTSFDAVVPPNVTTTFNGYATGVKRTKLTTDETGAFYALAGTGESSLYRYVIDPAQKKIVASQLMATGWGSYNLILGAGNGVIYSRNAAGVLFRTKFDPSSHRLIEPTKQVGNGGWNGFTILLSVGADIIVGVRPNGELWHYRYDATTGTWPIQQRKIGTSWDQFFDLPALPDACKLTTSSAPAAVTVPTEPAAPVAVHPNPDGQRIDYGYVNANTGKVAWGHQRDVNDFDNTVWPAPPLTTDTYAGVPSLVTHNKTQVGLVAQRNDGQFFGTWQNAATDEVLQPWRPEGGVLVGNAAPLDDTFPDRVPADSQALPSLYGVDAQGALWSSTAGATSYFAAWKRLAPHGMVGTPVVIPWSTKARLVVARSTNGGLVAHTEPYGTAPFPPQEIDLGGSGLTGRIAAVNVDGAGQVFVRDTSGAILTRKVSYSVTTGVTLTPWTQVGGTGITLAGSPSAARIPSGEVVVAARGVDGKIYSSKVTADTSTPWQPVSDLALTGDPTVFTYTNSAGPTWAIVSYNQDYQVSAFTPSTTLRAPALTSSATRAKTSSTATTFVQHIIKQ